MNALFPKGVGKNNAILGELCNSWLLTMRVHRKDARISSGIAHCQISEVALLPEMAVLPTLMGNTAIVKGAPHVDAVALWGATARRGNHARGRQSKNGARIENNQLALTDDRTSLVLQCYLSHDKCITQN